MFRIALLVNDVRVSKYVRDLIDWAEAREDVCICALIIHKPEGGQGRGGFKQTMKSRGLYAALSQTAFTRLSRVERKCFLRAPRYKDHLGSFDVSGRVKTQLLLPPKVSKSGHIYRFTEEQVEKVKALDADLLIRCGSGILKGGLLSAAKHGILSMHHGDNRVNRGGPAAFWEVLERHPETGFIVQRLNEELDGGDVLYRGSIPTEYAYVRNHAELMERSNHYLKRAILDIAGGRAEAEEPLLYDNRLYRTPLLADTLRYAMKTGALVLRRWLAKKARYRMSWSIAYLPGDWRNAVLWRGKVIENLPGEFLADPFALVTDEGRYIFAESYIRAQKKGVIAAFQINEDGSNTRLGTALEEETHLSFPYVFRYAGQLYMCPETSQQQQIRLYRCTGFPLRWELDHVIMDKVIANDTVIFEKEGRWWMLTSIAPAGALTNSSELYAFHADNPLSGDWTPHPLNPLVMDATRGRNGGLLRHGNTFYRVAQRRGFAQYGKGITICRIHQLDTEAYRETKIQDVDARFFPGSHGTHSLHHDGGLTVYDFCRKARDR